VSDVAVLIHPLIGSAINAYLTNAQFLQEAGVIGYVNVFFVVMTTACKHDSQQVPDQSISIIM
jgi:hypothetical protein